MLTRANELLMFCIEERENLVQNTSYVENNWLFYSTRFRNNCFRHEQYSNRHTFNITTCILGQAV